MQDFPAKTHRISLYHTALHEKILPKILPKVGEAKSIFTLLTLPLGIYKYI